MEETPKLIGFDYATISREILEILLEDTSEPGVFEEAAKTNLHRPDILRLILENPGTPQEVRKYIEERLRMPDKSSFAMVKVERARETRGESLTMKIQNLSVSARIHLALKGGREIRGILARDTNKEVMLSVLENGKITEPEIEAIARSRQTPEEVLRRIARSREWMRNYAIVYSLVTNPKTPAGISVAYVSDMKTRDLVMLERNRNLAEAVRNAAKKLLHARKPR